MTEGVDAPRRESCGASSRGENAQAATFCSRREYVPSDVDVLLSGCYILATDDLLLHSLWGIFGYTAAAIAALSVQKTNARKWMIYFELQTR